MSFEDELDWGSEEPIPPKKEEKIKTWAVPQIGDPYPVDATLEEDIAALVIDPLRLDVAWINQPILYDRWARRAAAANHDAAVAKQQLEVTKAEYTRLIGGDPASYKCKGTVDAINACVLEQPLFKEAYGNWLGLKHRADIYAAQVEALQQRKYALQKLVDLEVMNYHAAPRANTPGAREAMGGMEKEHARARMNAASFEDEDT